MEKLYFRADMNAEIATGHIMRCLSIADAAKKIGIDSVFILADNNAIELINQRGFNTIVLNTDWKEKEEELPVLLKIIKDQKIHKLIVDSYQVTNEYLLQLNKVVEVTYIDDVNAFDYPVERIICYANYYQRMQYGNNMNCKKFLLGCDYVPLRREFKGIEKKTIKDNIESILLMSGGSDQYHILRQLVERLAAENKYHLDVICGKYNTDYETMTKLYGDNECISIYQSVSNLIDYIKANDVAVSAGGSTLYELCACGTPAITFSFADNQLNNVLQFDEDKIMKYAGDIRNDNVIENVLEALAAYENNTVRRELSGKMQDIVDGEGAERIVKKLYGIE